MPCFVVLYPSRRVYEDRKGEDMDSFLRAVPFAVVHIRQEHMEDGMVAFCFVVVLSPEVYTGY